MFNSKKIISLFLCAVLLFGMAASAFAVDINTPATAANLTLDKKQTVNISKGGGKVYFTFTPDKTAVYEFISVSKGVDPCGYLYNSSMKQLVFNDDVIEELDFSVVYRLNKGEKYYFAASLYDSTKTGSFEVMLRAYDGIFIESRTGDIDVKPGEAAVLTVNAYSNADKLNYQWEIEYRTRGKSGSYYWTRKELQNGSLNTLTVNKASLSGNINCIITDNNENFEEVWFGFHVNSGLKANREGSEFRTVSAGGNETLSVNASAEYGSVYFQWYKEYKTSDIGGEEAWKSEIISGETKSALSLKNLTSPANYSCLVYDGYGNFEEIWFYVSINGGLTASAAGSAERSVKPGDNENLSVNAKVNKGNIHYQWYKKYKVPDNTGYTYKTEQISGGTAATLSLKNITQTADYACKVSDDFGNSEYVWFYVTVNSGFSVDPPYAVNLTVGTGIRATLFVKASGTGLTYKWGSFFFDDAAELGNTGQSEFITPALYDYTEFYCCVMDAYGNAQKVWFNINTDSSFKHSFGSPTWVWSSDYSSAAAKFVCKTESVHIETAKAKVIKNVISAPTCTGSGQTVYTASATFYDKPYTDSKTVTVSALGHSWDNGTQTLAPTTQKEGVITYKCTVCGSTKNESIPKLGALQSSLFTEREGYLYVYPQVAVSEIIKAAGASSKLQKSDGSQPKTSDYAGTGMTLIKPNGTKLTVIVKGDCDSNGEIGTSDARFALRVAVGLQTANAVQKTAALVDKNKAEITTSDARLILRAAVGLEKLSII